MSPFISRRLPPVVVGACRAVHSAVPLPEAGPPPGEELALVEVLRAQALMLAMSVEAITPGAM